MPRIIIEAGINEKSGKYYARIRSEDGKLDRISPACESLEEAERAAQKALEAVIAYFGPDIMHLERTNLGSGSSNG